MKRDSDLQMQVMRGLALDPHVDETTIGVSVHHGVVTLNGIVGSHDDKSAAEAAVHRVTGVLDVANDIEVKPSWKIRPSDFEIAEAVRNTLRVSLHDPSRRIHSTVSARGHVTLAGTVHTARECDDAEAAVRDLEGVEIVTNLIVVESPAVSMNALRSSIDHAVEEVIHRELGHTKIEPEIQGDTVVLNGTITSADERNAVLLAAKETPGVKRIDDRLRLVPILDPDPD